MFHEKMNTVFLLEYEKCCQINSHLRVDTYLVLKIPYFGGNPNLLIKQQYRQKNASSPAVV